MLKLLSQNPSTIKLKDSEPNKILNSLKEYISRPESEFMTVDIAEMNIIDACRISVLVSTEHYINHPPGKINWIVSSNSVEKYVSPMNLGNSSFLLK